MIEFNKLPVMEAFYTIQGEGNFQGKAAYFIRLGGCDVGCHWCDVKESWDINAHPLLLIDDIVSEASKYPSRIAVITGGEPLMHNLEYLTEALQNAGFRTHIETSGAYSLSGKWNWICVSPKKFKDALPDVCIKADELKCIVFNNSDFDFAEKYKASVSSDCKLFLQPEWDKQTQVLPSIIDYVKQHPEWGVSLQVHKFMQIP